MEAALANDDQCTPGDSKCTLSALQLRASKHNATVSTHSERGNLTVEESSSGSCTTYGCNGYSRWRSCQCNSHCHRYGNCCPDYDTVCHQHHSSHSSSGGSKSGCYKTGKSYKLNWQAEGSDFFTNWTFVTEDMVHGAQHFVSKEEARQKGIISTSGSDAFLKIGGLRYPSRPGEAYKRFAPHIRTNTAWDPKESFVVAMKFKHVPEGCGIWPGFWTVSSDELWPKGGELDILEYPNQDANKVTFHLDEHCQLDSRKIDQCAPHGHGGSGSMDCYTSYFKNAFGCRPKQRQHTGAEWARTPGVLAAEWTSEQITVFFFPDAHIPADLASNNPKPDTWSHKYVISYMPFKGACNSIGFQEIVLNIQLCGDAAGSGWERSACAYKTAMAKATGGCVDGLSQPRDCCTQYVTSLMQDSYMRQQAFFQINYIKVFTPSGGGGKPSSTFLRNGALMTG